MEKKKNKLFIEISNLTINPLQIFQAYSVPKIWG